MRNIAAVLALIGGMLAKSDGCGLHWAKPVNHFDGVDENGIVDYYEECGTVDFGNGTRLPLIIGFRSDRNTDSPYIGRGWMLHMLESQVYALDENRLRVIMPDGYFYTFGKDRKHDRIWRGERGWIGEFSGNRFIASAPCGWTITWTDGKISSLGTEHNQTIQYIYERGLVKELRVGGRQILKVSQTGGSEIRLTHDNTATTFRLERAPQVRWQGATRMINAVSETLSEVAIDNKWKRQFRIHVDEELTPCLTVVREDSTARTIRWNPHSGRILADGPWVYAVTQAGKKYPDVYRLERQNLAGQSEIWFSVSALGIEVARRSDGTIETTRRYVAGPAAGNLAEVVHEKSGKKSPVFAATYYASGAPQKTVDSTGKERLFDENGRLVEEKRQGELTFARTVDANDRTSRICLPHKGATIEYDYLANGTRKERVSVSGEPSLERYFDKEGRILGLRAF